MKKMFFAALAMGFFGLLAPASAQSNPNPSANAIAMAKQILAAKHVDALYREAVPAMVDRVKVSLLQNNLNYQKDLNEVAIKIAQDLATRSQQIGEAIAKAYASAFTEAELKDLVAWYQSPLGQKVIEQEPIVFNNAQAYMQSWSQAFAEELNGKFRAEMRARGKEI